MSSTIIGQSADSKKQFLADVRSKIVGERALFHVGGGDCLGTEGTRSGAGNERNKLSAYPSGGRDCPNLRSDVADRHKSQAAILEPVVQKILHLGAVAHLKRAAYSARKIEQRVGGTNQNIRDRVEYLA